MVRSIFAGTVTTTFLTNMWVGTDLITMGLIGAGVCFSVAGTLFYKCYSTEEGEDYWTEKENEKIRHDCIISNEVMNRHKSQVHIGEDNVVENSEPMLHTPIVSAPFLKDGELTAFKVVGNKTYPINLWHHSKQRTELRLEA